MKQTYIDGKVFQQSVGQPASIGAFGVSSHPHQLKRLGPRGRSHSDGRSRLLTLLQLEHTKVYAHYFTWSLVYPTTKLAEPRDDVTVTSTVSWLVGTSVMRC